MPDWLSHLLIGLILADLFNIKKKSLVVLGALAPDFLSKIFLIYLHLGLQTPISFGIFHTPFLMLLVSVLIAPLFRYDKLKIILYFNLGAVSHFLSDMTMKHFTGQGTRIFYPITSQNYTFNLIWPEQSIYILIASLAVYLSIKIIKKNKGEDWNIFKSIKKYF